MSLLQLRDSLCIVLLLGVYSGVCHKENQGRLCKSTCLVPTNGPKGQRHTFRYSSTITSSLKGPSSAGGQLAFDCVVDFDVFPGCTDMLLRIRNPQIKQSSLKKDNSVLRLKNIREALEKNPLRFTLQGGKVTALCPQEAEQVWTLNIKRAILSMLQTSHSRRARETVEETDIYGTCMTSYEQRGPSLMKTRHLQQCLRDRVNDFWWHSVPLKEDTAVNASLRCSQLHGTTGMDRVNCTENVALVPQSGSLDVARSTTVSTLTLLRTLDGVQADSGLQEKVYLADLRFKVETPSPARGGVRSVQEVLSIVRMLCAQSADQQQQSELFLSLTLLLRTLTLQQLKDVWQEVSFKCHDDWQPLPEALTACGSEDCVNFSTSLILNSEIDREHISALLSSITFTPRPSPSVISHISALLKLPLVRLKTVLAMSSLVHRLCRSEHTPCSQIPEVQQFVQVLKESLTQGCAEQGPRPITELLHVLKAVENIGGAAAELIPHLNDCIHNRSAPVELRLAAVKAFRRIPCHSQRGVLAWVYQQPQEDVEIRIAAYQQLLNCPDQETFRIIRDTLSKETSSQVGSFVWSHLFNIQKTEDPLKTDLSESLPHDIISKDFEAEPWKYSSHMDFMMDAGPAVANVEGALVFSPKSFLPRSAMANVTVHVLGRSFNLLEVALRMENAEPLLWSLFEGHHASNSEKPADQTGWTSHGKKRNKRSEERWTDERERVAPKDECKSSILDSKFTGQRDMHSKFQCWMSMKMFGIDLTFMTCSELLGRWKELSLRLAGVSVKLLRGQEVKVNQRAFALAEELVLPSLSGLPLKLSINMSSFYSLRLKGSANFKDWSQFSLVGYIKPSAFVGISARMGVDGAFGRVGLEWVTQVRTSASLDGGVYVHNGQSLKMVLNTPEDVMDFVSFSSRTYRVSGESKEELTASRNLKEKTTCTPKTWSKLFGWQLCSDLTYPVSLMGRGFPPAGPLLFSLRLQKLDRGLQKYLLEAAYTLKPQRNSWMPLEASLLIFLGTPQSTIPRDVSLDFSVSPRRVILKVIHPLKTIIIQGQLDELSAHWSGRAELLIDDRYHYYLKGLMETLSLSSEKKTHYQLEAKVAADGRPVILSVNVTHGLSRKISVSAKLRNVFSKEASFSVQLEWRQDDGRRQYSVDAGLLLPTLLNSRILGLVEHSGPEWGSGLRIRYGFPDDLRNMHECHTSQNLRDEVDPDENHYSMRLEHELQCSHLSFINHKIHLRHERSPFHIQSSLDLSYGQLWNQGSNKQRVLLSQSFRNQSGESLTSYALEFSLRIPEKGLQYRTQLLHSHLKRRKSERSTHLKINYNDQIPLVAGLHWKDVSAKSSLRKWEGSFNMDTPWVYVFMAHKLTQPQHGTTQFTAEITTRKWITIRALMLDVLYRERNRDREGHLHIFTPAITFLKVGGWSMLGKRRVNASCFINTAWTPSLKGEISLVNGKQRKTLDMNTSYDKQNLNISASLNTLEKKLKKNLLGMSMTLSELNSPYLEVEMGGRVEEMRKDKKVYKKQWVLHFRQPFKFLPEGLLLQETFTADQNNRVYILESKFLLHDNRKAIHVLTLGYQPQHPYVCSSLIHSFNAENVPQDSEMCISVHRNQTAQEIEGRMLTTKKEKLVLLGQVQHHGQQGITIKVNLTQLLQVKFPSTISLDMDLVRNHSRSKEFEYIANGNMAIDEKDYNAYFTIESSSAGNLSSSIYLGSNGKKVAALDASLSNTMRMGTHAVNFGISFQQTLLPLATADGHIHLSANLSSDSFSGLCELKKGEDMFWAQLSTAVVLNPAVQLCLSGDMIVSLTGLPFLPHTSSIAGLLNRSDSLSEGHLTVTVDHALYGVELRHIQGDTGCEEEINGFESVWLCVLARDRSLCVNISRSFIQNGRSGFHAQLHHSFPWLLSAGVPFNNSAGMDVNWSESGTLSEVGLHSGLKGLKITLQRDVDTHPASTGHLLVNFTGEFGPDHLRGFGFTKALDQSLRVKIWANLTDSIHVVPEKPTTSSLLLVIQSHHLTSSTWLKVNVSHNIPYLQPYVPNVFHIRLQLNHPSSSIQAATELLIGGYMLSFEGQVVRTKLGLKQVLDFYHTVPQLAALPSTVLVRTEYAGKNGSYILTHHTQWTHLSSARPAGLRGREVRDETVPRSCGWGLEVRLEKEAQTRRANVLVDWAVSGQQEQNKSRGGHRSEIRAAGFWKHVDREIEATLELKQPFTSTLSHLHLHGLSHSLDHGDGSKNQIHLSWDRGSPVNVSVTVSKHWNAESSRGQACVYISPGQMQAVLPLVDTGGCISVAQEGTSYSQSTVLKWSDKRVTQSMKHQRGPRGMHAFKVEAGVQNVSPTLCSSHTFLAQMRTNLRDFLEHRVLLELCPPQPGLSWSGFHRVNSGKDLLYSRTGLAVSGQALQHNTFTLAIRNASSSQRSNYSLLTEWKLGNWSIELGGSGHSSGRSTGLQVQARLDRAELFWMQAGLGKRCLQAAVGYDGGSSDDLRTTLCLEGQHWLTLRTQRGGSGIGNETLALISMGTANRSLILQAKGCEECLQATEAWLQQLGSHIKRKLLERVQKLHHLLLEFRRQAGGSVPQQELSDWPLRLIQRAEKLLLQRATFPWSVWTNGTLRHALTHSLPQTLNVLHHTSQLVQQELRKPLATLAEAYHDVTGVRLDTAWKQGLDLWRAELEELLPVILHHHHLRTMSLTSVHALITALDLVSQQTVHWAESRLAGVLAGVRRQLAYMYKFSKSSEEVRLRLPLPQTPWPMGSLSEMAEDFLEEFLLKPLLAVNSASITAELYRLKRRLMDSPFNHQAFVVADEFAVSFDGQLLALPASCDLILAADVTSNTFTITLKSSRPKQRSLVVQLRNTIITIHPNAQVEIDCRSVRAPFSNPDVSVTRELNILTVSNRRGLWVSCDTNLNICSITLDGWLHGMASGLLGTNDNEAGNENPLLDGSQAQNLVEFAHDWQVSSSCISATSGACQKKGPASLPCTLLFSSPTSPLVSCFRVVAPEQFLAVCERALCDTGDVSRNTVCNLASAYVHLCQRNYIPLEMPLQCG